MAMVELDSGTGSKGVAEGAMESIARYDSLRRAHDVCVV